MRAHACKEDGSLAKTIEVVKLACAVCVTLRNHDARQSRDRNGFPSILHALQTYRGWVPTYIRGLRGRVKWPSTMTRQCGHPNKAFQADTHQIHLNWGDVRATRFPTEHQKRVRRIFSELILPFLWLILSKANIFRTKETSNQDEKLSD